MNRAIGSTLPLLLLPMSHLSLCSLCLFFLFQGSCATSFQKSSCDASNTTEFVSSLCVGKNACTIPPDPTVRDTRSPLDQALGDPCPQVEKKLAVNLLGCDSERTTKVCLLLSCPSPKRDSLCLPLPLCQHIPVLANAVARAMP